MTFFVVSGLSFVPAAFPSPGSPSGSSISQLRSGSNGHSPGVSAPMGHRDVPENMEFLRLERDCAKEPTELSLYEFCCSVALGMRFCSVRVSR